MAEKESVQDLPLVPLLTGKTVNLKTAAQTACVSPDTIRRWCVKYGIGGQASQNCAWRVSYPGLLMVIACDSVALESFKNGEISNPIVSKYFEAERGAA